ncbi:amidase [Sulfitobacter sp. F26204]|uniref:amidase n=1 Tax=Sulfitobacter sp. F26204 TaxID=2996014 RepID=UPI00225E17C1|nr:amidase [Sulfitobacter sp. F26204]MCX7561715.1 amidase [Sulfitobacter sp. F26204]
MQCEATYDAIFTKSFETTGQGLRFGVKECLAVKGQPTRCGSLALANTSPAEENAEVVQRLLDSGCQMVGLTNMHELAFGVTGINPYYGTPCNRGWPERIPGGSSSGSAAAVAAGLCDFSLGTDTGGSVRMPACCCGVFGLKPTFGRLSRNGVVPNASSLDCVGVFATSMTTLIKAMAQLDPDFAAATLGEAPRLSRVMVDCSPEIAETLDRDLSGLTDAVTVLDSLDEAYDAGLTVINAEIHAAFGQIVVDKKLFSDVGERIRAAGTISLATLQRAEATRKKFRAEVDRALERADALILPTMPVVPPLLRDAEDMQMLIPLTKLVRPFNLSGHPAITIPTKTVAGLPAGIQLIARHGDDARLCAIAEWVAAQLPCHDTECTT